jgi:hypothetical protein
MTTCEQACALFNQNIAPNCTFVSEKNSNSTVSVAERLIPSSGFSHGEHSRHCSGTIDHSLGDKTQNGQH